MLSSSLEPSADAWPVIPAAVQYRTPHLLHLLLPSDAAEKDRWDAMREESQVATPAVARILPRGRDGAVDPTTGPSLQYRGPATIRAGGAP
jgi:hypothetical protein